MKDQPIHPNKIKFTDIDEVTLATQATSQRSNTQVRLFQLYYQDTNQEMSIKQNETQLNHRKYQLYLTVTEGHAFYFITYNVRNKSVPEAVVQMLANSFGEFIQQLPKTVIPIIPLPYIHSVWKNLTLERTVELLLNHSYQIISFIYSLLKERKLLIFTGISLQTSKQVQPVRIRNQRKLVSFI